MTTLGSLQWKHQELPPSYPLPLVDPVAARVAYYDWSLPRRDHMKLIGSTAFGTAMLHGFVMNSTRASSHFQMPFNRNNRPTKTLLQTIREIQWFTRGQSVLLQTAEIGMLLSTLTWFHYKMDNPVGGLLAGVTTGVGVSLILAPQMYYNEVILADKSLTSVSKRMGAFARSFRPHPRYMAFYTLSHVLSYSVLCTLFETLKIDLAYLIHWTPMALCIWGFAYLGSILQYGTMQLFLITQAVNERLVGNKCKPMTEWIVLKEKYHKKGKVTALLTGFYRTRPGFRSTAAAVAISVYDLLCRQETEKLSPSAGQSFPQSRTLFWNFWG